MNYGVLYHEIKRDGENDVLYYGHLTFRINPETNEIEEAPSDLLAELKEKGGYIPEPRTFRAHDSLGFMHEVTLNHVDETNVWLPAEYMKDENRWEKSRVSRALYKAENWLKKQIEERNNTLEQ